MVMGVSYLEQKNWESLMYSDNEFHTLYEASKGFNDDINKNHRIRKSDESFSSFVDEGSSALIEEHPSLVKMLL
jgi:hypothetical protein